MAFYVLCLRDWFVVHNTHFDNTCFTDVELKSLPTFCSCYLNFAVEEWH